ncbi:MAG TPA: ribosome biogenesis GTPase Der [Longimicrobiales bacterium]|nr:ribosome biogenesis GTPase Der [Longimicrobiales bacterium]
MRHGLPTVAVVGRPNVGKSTFFNRILGQKLAIVEDQPGVTRDRNFARAEWAGRAFYLVDTGGIEVDTKETIPSAVRHQVDAAIKESDLIVFVVDAIAGPHPVDFRVAEMLRVADRPVMLVVNKMDRWPEDQSHLDFWQLGLSDPIPVSSVSGKGSGDLLDTLVSMLPEQPEEETTEEALYVAVIGKPNVGKSSFINKLLGEERLVVTPMAGTTRDSIDTPYRFHGRTIIFIDTAGLRKQAKIDPGVEYFSSLRTQRAIDRADVCILMIDATEEDVLVQDLRIAEKAWSAGASLVVVVNKWDLVEKETGTAEKYEKKFKERAPQLRWVPMIFTSAITGQRVTKVLDHVVEVAEARKKRVSTRMVNEVLKELAIRQPPPHYRGFPVKLLYATQADTQPPTFVIFVNHPKALPESYLRYLHNGFREAWGFRGTPLRIRLRARREQKEA